MFYLELFGALGSGGVDYVVVGGLALNLHGVERATMDVDLAIALDEGNLRRAVAVFQALDLRPIAPVRWDEVTAPGQLARWRADKHMLVLGLQKASGMAPTVDVLTALPVPFADLLRNSVIKELAGLRVPVAGIDDLINLKRDTGRAIDKADIEALEKLKRIKVHTIVRSVDCSYTISEDRIRAYLEVPEIERLRWLDELVRFTLMWRAAPEASRSEQKRSGNRIE